MKELQFNQRMLRLYAVTDRRYLNGRGLKEAVEESIIGGVTIVQLREKRMNKHKMTELALSIKEVCSKYKVPFVINDDLEVAIKSDADGIHIGQDDLDLKEVKKALPSKIVGVSVQTVEQAIKAFNDGADYLGVGAVFTTATKSDALTVSLETLTEIANAVDIPVVAIGGINQGNIRKLQGTNIKGVAVVSALYSGDVCQNAINLRKEVSKYLEEENE